VDWALLRGILKYKIDKNVALFLSGPPKSDETTTSPPWPGSFKLPPFPPRERDERSGEAQKKILNEKEAADFKQAIYSQLDTFDSNPPFTIQRVAELCLRPQKHYKYLGNYLRAVERTLLVTSTWDAFPAIPEAQRAPGSATFIPVATSALSAPSTPIFSPIPFLHEDARRSASRSPPPSPLVLPAMSVTSTPTADPHAGTEGAEAKALGLVDEMDDPGPGHLSEHPQPISSTTTVVQRPLHGSLGDRFVKAKTEAEESAEPSQAKDTPMAEGEAEKK